MSEERRMLRDRLEVLDALAVALERRTELSAAIEASDDEVAALRGIRDLLGVSEAGATAVLHLQWTRFTREGTREIYEERDRLRKAMKDK